MWKETSLYMYINARMDDFHNTKEQNVETSRAVFR